MRRTNQELQDSVAGATADTVRKLIEQGLASLEPKHRDLFGRMYPDGVTAIADDKLSWAYAQVMRTVEGQKLAEWKHPETRDGERLLSNIALGSSPWSLYGDEKKLEKLMEKLGIGCRRGDIAYYADADHKPISEQMSTMVPLFVAEKDYARAMMEIGKFACEEAEKSWYRLKKNETEG